MMHAVDDMPVITGCGWVTPSASGSCHEVLAAGRGRPQSLPAGCAFWPIEHSATAIQPEVPESVTQEKDVWLAAVALQFACRQAALDPKSIQPDRAGIVLGSALAGQAGMIAFAQDVRSQSSRFVSPIHFPQTVGNYVAGAIGRAYHLRGPNVTVACGTASGLDAIAEACALLPAQELDVVFAGGLETLSPQLASAFARPGMIPSEGACIFVIEPRSRAIHRGVRPAGVVLGSHRIASPADLPYRNGKHLISAAGCCVPGGIYIEDWIGNSFAAAGAASVAASLGAAAGLEVPVTQGPDPATAAIARIDLAAIRPESGPLTAVMCAEADGAHCTVLELSIPSTD